MIENQSPDMVDTIYVDCVYVYSSSSSSYQRSSMGYIYVNTTPSVIAKKNFGVTGVLSYIDEVKFGANRKNSKHNVEVRLYKVTSKGTKFKKSMTFSSDSSYTPVDENAVYKYRVRAYYDNYSTGKKVYGPWSSYRYFDNIGFKVSTRSDTRGCKLTLKGVYGVKNYSIYVSKYEKSGFKKTATVAVTTGKTKTVSINKIGTTSMTKGRKYYVRVIPNIKVGSSTVKSDVYGTTNFTNPR